MDLQLLSVAVPRRLLPAVEDMLGGLEIAIWADLEGDPEPVPVEATLPPNVSADRVEAALRELFDLFGETIPALTIRTLAARDWVAEVEKTLPAQRAGRFYIYGSHVKTPPPEGTIPILVEAAMAFGTGHHESTRGCLEALSEIPAEEAPSRVLDMGCGSGVLAIAAAKLFGAKAVAVDIDKRSVTSAAANAEENGVAAYLTCRESDGYAAAEVAAGRPYDLIFSNILAKPLIAFAPDLAAHLKPGGHAILAGLLTREAEAVVAAHEAAGLTLAGHKREGDWSTLVLRKATA